jgi:hypothetical protein
MEKSSKHTDPGSPGLTPFRHKPKFPAKSNCTVQETKNHSNNIFSFLQLTKIKKAEGCPSLANLCTILF